MKKILPVLTILFLTTGCISHPGYPKEWVAVSDGNICQRLNGKYRNSGVNHDGRSVYLTKLLFDLNTGDADSVEIQTGLEHIKIDAYYEGVLVKSYTGPLDSNLCESSFLDIKVSEPDRYGSGGGVIGFAHTTSMRFFKNDYDELIVSEGSLGGAIVVVIPFVFASTSWSKFIEQGEG